MLSMAPQFCGILVILSKEEARQGSLPPREIVKECQDAITQHIAEMKQRTPPHDLLLIAGAEKELLGVQKAMERLKD
jgi:hypothetical protein